jgi:Bacteriocin-protection, YdeI or OmpD-Associated/Domain of unknown function (DUF1905)
LVAAKGRAGLKPLTSIGQVTILTAQRFNTIIAKYGTRTMIVLPFNPNDVWGFKQRHYIVGSVNGCRVRGPLDSNGTQYFLPLGAAWRRDNNLDAGANVDVVLSPEGPQSESLSPDVSSALDAEPEARAFFDALASFYRKNYVRWIESAKRPETRSARIAEMVKLLKARQKQK